MCVGVLLGASGTNEAGIYKFTYEHNHVMTRQ
jgi:hypothetical protein